MTVMTDFLIKTSTKTSIKWENITYKLKRTIPVLQKDIIKICIFLAKLLNKILHHPSGFVLV